MSPRDLVYVGHMLDMARKAVAKTAGSSRDAYDQDENLRLALTHLVQVIGEAARHVSREFTDAHPEMDRDHRYAPQGRPRLSRCRRGHRLAGGHWGLAAVDRRARTARSAKPKPGRLIRIFWESTDVEPRGVSLLECHFECH